MKEESRPDYRRYAAITLIFGGMILSLIATFWRGDLDENQRVLSPYSWLGWVPTSTLCFGCMALIHIFPYFFGSAPDKPIPAAPRLTAVTAVLYSICAIGLGLVGSLSFHPFQKLDFLFTAAIWIYAYFQVRKRMWTESTFPEK